MIKMNANLPIGEYQLFDFKNESYKIKIALQGKEGWGWRRTEDEGTNIIFLLLICLELLVMIQSRAEPGHEKCNDTGESI